MTEHDSYTKYRFKAKYSWGWSSAGFEAGALTFDSIEEANRIREHSPLLFIVRIGGTSRDLRIALFKCTTHHDIIE